MFASLKPMKIGPARFVLPLLVLGPLMAQDYYPRHNFTFGTGAALPRGDLGSALADAPGISIGYGYRFQRYLQADIGFDAVFGAAQVRQYVTTDIGDFRVGDREYSLPFGGRAIAPVFKGRLLISGGAGGVWMKYHERLSQPSSDFQIGCPICTARSGWGYYVLANASCFLDSGKHFRAGVTTREVRGHTDGEPLGGVPGFETKDRWLTITAEFGFSF